VPQFLDQFITKVRTKRDRMLQQLSYGRKSPLDNQLADLMTQNWNKISQAPPEPMEMIAVDGSEALRPFANGCSLYVARALALHKQQRFRELEVDTFFSGEKMSDVKTFVTRKMEWTEIRAAHKALVEGNLREIPLLIDGSLYGRTMHLPRDTAAEGQRGFMLRYFEDLGALLQECRSRHITLMGVSKDSRVSHLRNHLLSHILSRELETLGASVEDEDKKRIAEIYNHIRDMPAQSMRALRELREKYGDFLDRVQEIMNEAHACRPDFQMIKNFANNPGYSNPLELGPNPRSMRLLNEIRKDPWHYAELNFKKAITEAENEADLLNQAIDVLIGIQSLPTMVSLYVLLDPRDTPLRVDTPSWTFGLDHSLTDLEGTRRLNVDVSRIVTVLQSGYAGLTDYNIFLKKVDEEVKLTRKTMDELYTSALQKALSLTVIHTRGYRRVKYP